MTREEAIKDLHHLILKLKQADGDDRVYEHYKEVIETLQTDPCEDAISRQAAIDAIHFYCKNICGLSDYNWCSDCPSERFVGLMKELPSVTAERKPAWTPVKTRPLTDEERDGLLIDAECAFDCPMPEDGQEVIVTTDLGGVGIDTFCRDVEGCYFENYDDDVIAWMPLPEPWKEAGE